MAPLLSTQGAVPPEGAETQHRAIVFEKVVKSLEGKTVLDGISFGLPRGETKVLLGVAGAGKSTILKLTLGLLKPDAGNIYVLGHPVSQMKEEDLFELRDRIGMVFQESALFDSLTVEGNVAYRLLQEGDISPEDAHKRVVEALRFVELEQTVEMFPSELSGGMRRRVAIARAVFSQPEILLYDSPTAGLDPVTSTKIIELIVKERDVYKTSALLVSHRLQDAFIMATHYFDREANEMRPLASGSQADVHTTFLVLRDGRIIFDGAAAELVHSRDDYIREYLS